MEPSNLIPLLEKIFGFFNEHRKGKPWWADIEDWIIETTEGKPNQPTGDPLETYEFFTQEQEQAQPEEAVRIPGMETVKLFERFRARLYAELPWLKDFLPTVFWDEWPYQDLPPDQRPEVHQYPVSFS